MTFVAGCDYSTFTADVVLLPWDGEAADARWWRIPLRDSSLPDNLQAFHAAVSVRAVLVPALPWEQIDAIYLEAPLVVGQRIDTTIKLARIQGALLACIPSSVTVGEVPVGTWKKEVGLSGQASKQAVRDWAIEHGFVAVRPDEEVQDAYDAFAIAWAMREQSRRASPRPALPAF